MDKRTLGISSVCQARPLFPQFFSADLHLSTDEPFRAGHRPSFLSFGDKPLDLAEVRQGCRRITAIATPFRIISALCDPVVETKPLPCVRTAAQSVLHRIVMDVIHMAVEIVVVTNLMFPVARLPDAAPALSPLVGGHGRFPAAGRRAHFDCCRAWTQPSTREALFDFPPARGEIGVAFRQSPQGVQVVRQQHDGRHVEWTALPGLQNRSPQMGPCRGVGKDVAAWIGHPREEKRAAGLKSADKCSHPNRIIDVPTRFDADGRQKGRSMTCPTPLRSLRQCHLQLRNRCRRRAPARDHAVDPPHDAQARIQCPVGPNGAAAMGGRMVRIWQTPWK